MNPLTCLADLMPAHLDEEPRREQRGWVTATIRERGLVQLEREMPAILQSVLKRSVIVRLLPDRGEREMAPLRCVWVDADTLAWVPEDQYSWELMSPTSHHGGPSMRLRRQRGRDLARRNKALRAAQEAKR